MKEAITFVNLLPLNHCQARPISGLGVTKLLLKFEMGLFIINR